MAELDSELRIGDKIYHLPNHVVVDINRAIAQYEGASEPAPTDNQPQPMSEAKKPAEPGEGEPSGDTGEGSGGQETPPGGAPAGEGS